MSSTVESLEARDVAERESCGDAPRQAADRARRITSVAAVQSSIFVGAFLLYALLPTRNFNYADDSLAWAYQLTQSGGVVNSHHLYLNGMRWLYQLLHGAGVTVDPLTLLALYSAVWGAAGLAILYRLLVRAGMANEALWATLVCAFSAGYWTYSIIGDVYIPAIGLMMVGLYFVYSGLTTESARSARQYAVGAVLAFLAMLAHHQAFAVLVVGLVPAVLLMRTAAAQRRRVSFAVVVPVAVCLFSVALYAVAYLAMPAKQQQGFIQFGSGYVETFEPRPDQKQLGLGSLANMAVGEARALVSTNVIFRSDEVAQSIQAKYPYRATYPFPYLVRNVPIPVAVLIGMAACLAALLTAYLFARGLWTGLREKGLVVLVFVPMIPQAVFFAWWEGVSDEFALWTLPLIAIIAARGAAEVAHPLHWLRAIATGFFVSTLVGSTLLYWNPQNDIDFVNDEYTNSLGENDVLIGFEDIQSDFRMNLQADKRGFRYLNYFNIRNSADASAFDASLEAAVRTGTSIHVSPRLAYPPKSAVVFKQSTNPDFVSQRDTLLAKLKGIPGVDWVMPVVLSEQYFQLSTGAQAPH